MIISLMTFETKKVEKMKIHFSDLFEVRHMKHHKSLKNETKKLIGGI